MFIIFSLSSLVSMVKIKEKIVFVKESIFMRNPLVSDTSQDSLLFLIYCHIMNFCLEACETPGLGITFLCQRNFTILISTIFSSIPIFVNMSASK